MSRCAGIGADVLNVRDEDKSANPASWQRFGAYILDTSHGGVCAAMAEETDT